MTELSWPIEKIEPALNSLHQPSGKWWVYPKQHGNNAFVATADDLAAAGIPAEPYPTPPVTITVTVGDRSEVVELTDSNIETDIVTEARRLLDGSVLWDDDHISNVLTDLVAEVERLRGELEYEQGAKARLYGEVATRIAEVERLRQQVEGHEKVVDWADDALARRDARITELIAERDAALAEVERLRALDQRTDPELARALNNLAATYDGSMYLVNAAADLRAAARLLGGDQ